MHRIVAFVLAQGPVQHGHLEAAPEPAKGDPAYAAAAIPRQKVLMRKGDLTLKAYVPNVLLAECVREVDDVFSQEAFEERASMIKECKKLLEQHHAKAVTEEYAIALVDGYKGSAEQFLTRASAIVRFLKSEPLALHKNEVAHAIGHQITYGENDLFIIDWDGAFVFQQDGKTDALVDIIQAANLHLLQYRMLDAELDKSLKRIGELIHTKKISRVVFWNRELTRAYREVIRMHTESIVAYDAIVREIKLIGDWYSARVYEAAAHKFKLDGWRASVKDKLETLEDAYNIVSQNFRISKEHFFELMIQVGWFALIFIEAYRVFAS